MGGGIAFQIARKYPEALKADREFPIPVGSRERLGKFSVVEVKDPIVGRRLVFNLYGQFDFGRGRKFTQEDQLELAVRGMLKYLQENEDPEWVRIGFPYGMGAGLGGGDWSVIEEMLDRCSREFNMDFELYQLKK
jgi:O-acetyl-ADP-ribose deacetylase (regulator of RNase III)